MDGGGANCCIMENCEIMAGSLKISNSANHNSLCFICQPMRAFIVSYNEISDMEPEMYPFPSECDIGAARPGDGKSVTGYLFSKEYIAHITQ